MDVRQKVDGGFYKSNLPFPEYVRKPDILRKRVAALNTTEMLGLPQILADYEKAQAAYNAQAEVYRKDDARLQQQFFDDLHKENGIDPNSEMGQLIWSKAWEHGHSNGLSNVLYYFEDFMDFHRVAEKMVKAALKK